MQASKTARRVCVANPILPEITAATKFDVGSIDSMVAREGPTFFEYSTPVTVALLSHGVPLQQISATETN